DYCNRPNTFLVHRTHCLDHGCLRSHRDHWCLSDSQETHTFSSSHFLPLSLRSFLTSKKYQRFFGWDAIYLLCAADEAEWNSPDIWLLFQQAVSGWVRKIITAGKARGTRFGSTRLKSRASRSRAASIP